MAKKTSVQFYYDYIEQLQDLDDKQFRKVLEAMVVYDETEKIVNMDSITKVAFNFIKKRIDYDKEKYNLICERNKENGKNGGRPKNLEEPKKPSGLFGNPKNPEEPKKPDIDIDLDIDKDIDLDLNKDLNLNNNIISSSSNNIYDFIEQNFSRTLSPIEYELVSQWKDNELTRYAIKQSILGGIYNLKYIDRILENYKKNNITTVQQAQEEEKQFKKKKEEKEKYKGLSFKEQQYLREQELMDKWVRGEN